MAKQLKTGIVLSDRALHWTTMQQGNKGEYTIAERQSSDPIPVEETSEGDAASSGETAIDLVELFEPNANRLKGELHFALPAHQVLLRVMDLPTHEDEEIEGMVEFQIDKVSPFPVDHMYLSWEKLDETEDHTRVLVSGTQRKFVDAIGDSCRESGLILHRVDVDLLCWIHLLERAEEIPEHGRHIMVLLDKDYANLVIFDYGIPFLFRSLGEMSRGDDHDELLEEIEYTLTSTETEWGEQEYVTCTLWHWGQPPKILEQLERTVGSEVHTRNLSSLADLHEGVALRAATDAGLTDLAPLEWKEAEESRKFRKNLMIGSACIMGIWLVSLIAFFSWLGIERGEQRELQAQKDALTEPANEVRALQNRVAELSQYTNRTHAAIECLRETIVVLPSEVELTSFTYDNRLGVRIYSQARQKSRLDQFYKGLTESEVFIGLKDDSFDGNKMKVTALIPQGDDS